MVFSFIEALARYTIITDSEYNNRISTLTTRITNLRNNKVEEHRLKKLKDSFENSYKTSNGIKTVVGWNKKIIDIIQSENTRSQLGLAYDEFKNKFIKGDSLQDL